MVLIKYDFPSCVLIINEEKIVFKNGHTNSLFPKLSAYKDFSHIFRKIYVNDIFPVDNFTEECASLEKDNSSSANRLNLDDIIRKRENDSKRNSEAWLVLWHLLCPSWNIARLRYKDKQHLMGEKKNSLMIMMYENKIIKNIKELNCQSEYKDRLLATVSHDLRTRLNGIIGIIHLAMEKITDNTLRK
jgi:hypothetical protein